MIEIKTYLDGNGCDDAKIPYEEYFGALCNERDGAIEFIIDGKLLFRHQGEYINIEWTSILYTILMFLSKEGKTIKDAPLVESEACIHLEPMGCEMLKIIHPYARSEVLMDDEGLPYHRVTEKGEKIAVVNKEEFLRVAVIEGWRFFNKLIELIPEEKKNYEEEEIKWIGQILSVLEVDSNKL